MDSSNPATLDQGLVVSDKNRKNAVVILDDGILPPVVMFSQRATLMILSKWLTGFTETLTRSRHGNGRGHRRRPQMQEVLRPSDLAKRVDALEDRTLLAANIAPVNSVPGSQTTQVNTPLGFTEIRDNLITTSDADAGLNPVVATLTAQQRWVPKVRWLKCSGIILIPDLRLTWPSAPMAFPGNGRTRS